MCSADEAIQTARRVVPNWEGLAGASVTPVAEGLINQTFKVVTPGGGAFALQRVNPIFAPEVHLDIDAITGHVSARGLPTPRLVPTRLGELWADDEGIWRLLTWLPGRTIGRVVHPDQAREAGALVGRFHVAVADLDHSFHFTRFAHGLSRHAARLREALETHPGHPLRDRVAELAAGLLRAAGEIPTFDGLPRRICHGDLKISNVLFLPGEEDPAADLRAHALLDLDTFSRLDLPTELGDALRSWCNPEGEDGGEPQLDLTIFEAAVQGYALSARRLVGRAEQERLVDGLEALCVELACRFAADALNEDYFGWDPARFPSRGEHNLHRALVQRRLARSVRARRAAAERLVRRAFGR